MITVFREKERRNNLAVKFLAKAPSRVSEQNLHRNRVHTSLFGYIYSCTLATSKNATLANRVVYMLNIRSNISDL